MDVSNLSGMWRQVREGIRSQQESMPVFAAAPRIIQEGLLFPYLAGADFVRGFNERRARPDEEPYGNRMPVSTEQILHPGKYSAHERPARIRLTLPPGDTLIYDDDFGEFETRIALETWGVGEDNAVAAASGWNGDRFEILGTRAGTALVWIAAWDSPADAAEFAAALRTGWQRRTGARAGRYGAGRAERRWQVDALTLGGVQVVRLVDAPVVWTAWRALPSAQVGR